MDIIEHGTISALLALGITSEPVFIIGSGITGMMPDIIGLSEKILKRDWHAWNWYRSAHKLTIINLVIPFWNLHVLIDKFWHDPITGKWKPGIFIISIASWLLIIFFLILIIQGK